VALQIQSPAEMLKGWRCGSAGEEIGGAWAVGVHTAERDALLVALASLVEAWVGGRPVSPVRAARP